jgi:hypothetical protein
MNDVTTGLFSTSPIPPAAFPPADCRGVWNRTSGSRRGSRVFDRIGVVRLRVSDGQPSAPMARPGRPVAGRAGCTVGKVTGRRRVRRVGATLAVSSS